MAKQAIPKLVPQAHDVDISEDLRSPIEVLRTQATYWTELTKGDLVGEVEQTKATPERIAYWFGFVVPALDGYRYRLFIVEHGIDFYPLWIAASRGDPKPVELNDEEAYFEELRRRFGSQETLNTVRQLRALAAEAQPRKKAAVGG